ncbi:ADP-ribosylglycohydrolase family protein [Actinomadura parmotrematis]|uniref:ADP-ribosylglycohydrolase family protein n=1 Tax=Actinomadura parmotrematis TaxID=2864039 RepID=A0ABS7FQ00_9ACTN|nr:ADP-ribosylglycohydrolase family protein [Actinomadura parmotrematis]MBW8481628.1 ADP-ribosylglycohydrolase family protein [Actinomadura parmotrematis]
MTALDRRRRAALARDALDGLSVGDAFGDQFFLLANRDVSRASGLPPAPWAWSDDTQMACSVLAVLNRCGRVEQDILAEYFANHLDLGRGYGYGAALLLERVRTGTPWREAASDLFDGKGSFGNGAAMRVAPLGAHFSADLAETARQATLSAEVTHAHPEGIAGAVAAAVATAHATARRGTRLDPRDLLTTALDHTPATYVRRGLATALRLLDATPAEAAHALGNGNRISAQDTVPFALWAAATRLTDYESAVRACVAVGGDMDTTAAIAGGIVGAHLGPAGLPDGWTAAREPLPDWIDHPAE